jgi:NADH:ubiquinone reductase (H+-translocating)
MAWNVLILGGGFGGFTAARKLERILPEASAKVTLVNDVNFLLYTPLLPGAAAGTLEPRHVVVPLREELHRTDLKLGHVVSGDPSAQTVRVRLFDSVESNLPYDQLIVALGSTSRTLPIPGLRDHAIGLKTLSEAITMRNRLVQTLEAAETTDDEAARRALLTYVVVGAGYAGVETVAELQDFAADVGRYYPRSRLHGLRFMLVEARDEIMPEVGASLAAFARSELRRRGIEIRTETTVERVSRDTVELSDGEIVPTRSLAWTAGVKPHPSVTNLGLPLDDDGRISTGPTCQVEGLPNVWAIGDAAGIPDPARPGSPSPPTAQHATRQAKVAARNVAASLGNEDAKLKRFRYRTLGVFVDMGRHQAVASTVGIKWRGFPAWFLARTYHLAMIPGAKRRLLLLIDWTVGLLFRRDSSELGQLGHPPELDDAGLEEVSAGGSGEEQAASRE